MEDIIVCDVEDEEELDGRQRIRITKPKVELGLFPRTNRGGRCLARWGGA